MTVETNSKEEALPEWCAEPCVMGIDEAGRGPVLGPMVYGCAYCRIADKEYLAGQKYDDSKKLTEEKREELFELIKRDEKLGWKVDNLGPRLLSAKMLRREKYNLNAISHDSARGLIQGALDRGVNIQEVFVDTVGDATSYQESLSKRFPGITFVVCPKADSLYPIVSAASIAAKVTRDHALRDWAFEGGLAPGREFGSGYPGDPLTKAWLSEHMENVFGYPSIVRFSWGTTKQILDTSAARVEWEADEEEEVRGNQKLTFGGVPVAQRTSEAPHRHSYFKSRKLQKVAAF